MEYLTVLIPIALLFYFNNTSPDNKSGITKINDKNWIVNNELISFEEDTIILRFEQEMEDNNFYREYERNRLSEDREYLGSIFFKTTKFIRDNPSLIETDYNYLTKDQVRNNYTNYLNMCNKLDEALVLSEEEYTISQNNILHCISINFTCPPYQMYRIHNEKTAKYKGNSAEKLREEFKSKWY
jgi:hypothetical protein